MPPLPWKNALSAGAAQAAQNEQQDWAPVRSQRLLQRTRSNVARQLVQGWVLNQFFDLNVPVERLLQGYAKIYDGHAVNSQRRQFNIASGGTPKLFLPVSGKNFGTYQRIEDSVSSFCFGHGNTLIFTER